MSNDTQEAPPKDEGQVPGNPPGVPTSPGPKDDAPAAGLAVSANLGQIVKYRFKNTATGAVVIRPAIVVGLIGPNIVNLQVFLDGLNDKSLEDGGGNGVSDNECRWGSSWKTSVPFGDKVGHWTA